MIRNKILVVFNLEEGCSQDAGEVSSCWQPINFMIYHPLFTDLIVEAIDNWLGENEVKHFEHHEVIFAHEIYRDAGGAVLGECFIPISREKSIY